MHNGDNDELTPELLREKKRFNALLNASMDGYICTDLQGTILEINETYCTMSGYTQGELIGHPLALLDGITDMEKNRARIEEIRSRGNDRFETRHRTKDGETLELEASVSYVDIDDGRIVTLLHDISSRKKREKDLTREHILLETIINSIPTHLFWKDAYGRFLGVNSPFLESVGLEKPEEILGKSDFELPWKDVAESYRADDLQVMQNGQAKLNILETFPQANGSLMFLNTSKVPLRNERNEIIGVLGVFDDITEEYETSQRLKESKEELETMFELSRDGIAIMDLASNLLKVNEAFVGMSGFSRAELLQNSLETLTLPEERHQSSEAIRDVVANGFFNNLEQSFPRENGDLVRLNLSMALMPDKERILLNIRDITQQKQYERQLLKNKTELEGEVEIRTEALSHLQKDYQRFIDNIGSEFVIYSIDAQNDETLFVSSASTKVFALAPKAIIGHSWFDIIAWESHSKAQSLKNIRLFKEGTHDIIRNRLNFFRPDGSFRVAEETTYAVRDASGQCIKIDGIIEDITKWEMAMQKYRRFIETFGNDFIIYSYTPGTGVVQYVSDAVKTFMGLDGREILGKAWTDILEWDPEPLQETIENIRAIIDNQLDSFKSVLGFTHKNGEHRVGMSTSYAIRDRSGTCISIDGIMEDITDKVNADAKLEESEQFLRNIMEGAADGIVTIDEEGIIQAFNKAAETLFGYTREEIIGQNVALLIPSPHTDSHDRYINRYLRTGISNVIGRSNELPAVRKNGTKFPASIRIGEIKTHGRRIFTALIQDITERKQAENAMLEAKRAAESAARMKSEFLANMSHEIRTPMNAIIGMSQLALETDLDPKQRNYIEKVSRSSEMLLSIINDILDMSKIEAGKLTVETVPFSIDAMLDDLGDAVSFMLREKELELVYWVDSDVPRFVIGDPMRLRQIILNLVGNAIKFTPKGGGDIILRVEPTDRDSEGVQLHFSIEDNGIGMDAAQVQRLFQAFTQADASTSRTYGGTGLGLVICKRLVELMGGKIWAQSEPGAGSVFHFSLYFNDDKTAGMADDEQAGIQTTNLLFVDGHKTIRTMILTAMQHTGFKVWTAGSTVEALQCIEKMTAPMDVMVIEWKMNGEDTHELVHTILHRSRSDSQPKIIITTSEDLLECRKAFEGLEISAFLNKPFSASALNDAIAVAFNTPATHHDASPVRQTVFPESGADFHGIRLLLVEDNDVNKELAVDLLESAGITLEIASNGQEALDILATTTVDGVLMDCQMPVMDGYEATRRIRADARLRTLPVLALTANALEEDRRRAIDAGVNDQINKPIRPTEMFSTIAKWIKPSIAAHANMRRSDPSATGEAIPVIEGLDTAKGLFTTQNNATLYLRLLRKFRDSDADSFETVFHQAIVSDDQATAQRAVHTLKGTAGSLGATALYDEAKRLDEACRNGAGRSEIDALLEPVLLKLRRLLNALEVLGSETTTTPSTRHLLDRREATDLIKRIIFLISDYDAEALDVIEKIRNLPGIDMYYTQVKALGSAIEEFDNEQALDHAKTLLDHIKSL